jgi:hypothetical protein
MTGLKGEETMSTRRIVGLGLLVGLLGTGISPGIRARAADQPINERKGTRAETDGVAEAGDARVKKEKKSKKRKKADTDKAADKLRN